MDDSAYCFRDYIILKLDGEIAEKHWKKSGKDSEHWRGKQAEQKASKPT
jgi:hypothetical protein